MRGYRQRNRTPPCRRTRYARRAASGFSTIRLQALARAARFGGSPSRNRSLRAMAHQDDGQGWAKIGPSVGQKENGLGPLRPNPLNCLARPRRFERPTPAFGGQYSIQLSYGRGGDYEVLLVIKRASLYPFPCEVHAGPESPRSHPRDGSKLRPETRHPRRTAATSGSLRGAVLRESRGRRDAQHLTGVDLVRVGQHRLVGLEDHVVVVRVAVIRLRDRRQGIAARNGVETGFGRGLNDR